MKTVDNHITHLKKCRMCESKRLKSVINLGLTPLANSFLSKQDLHSPESFYPLEVNFCKVCGQLQLAHVVHPDLLFRNYVYVSSTSPKFVQHFKDYAKSVYEKLKLKNGPLVIDIGSNDGVLLKPFKKLGARVVGVDPAIAISEKATKQGIQTIPEYFDKEVAKQILKRHGVAQVITANNVFAHTHDIDHMTEAVKIVLAKDGVFIIEAPYLIDFLENNYFDTVYHEHLSYLSIRALTHFFKRHKMTIFDVEKTSSHGGSIRVFVKKNESKRKVEPSVRKFIKSELKTGLDKEKTYLNYENKIRKNKIKLVKMLNRLKINGAKIYGYGAPAKGNTLLNYFGIGSDILDYIIDDSPLKQGLYTPGTHIPVVSSEIIKKSPPDYILILAWNFAEPIMEKMADFSAKGGKFIIPAPTPSVIYPKMGKAKNIVNEDIIHIIEMLGKDIYKLEGKTLLISGGSGFLGSFFTQTIQKLNKDFFKKPCKVLSLDNYITGTKKMNFLGKISDPNIIFKQHDVRLPLFLNEKVDYIIHAAGLASPVHYKSYPLETIESTFIGAKNLLELSRLVGVESFLFFSSSEIYGNPEPEAVPTPETYHGRVSSTGPRACYDESKRLTETLCVTHHQMYGTPIKMVRPFNVYGPGMKPTDYRVIPTFLQRGLTGQFLPVHDQGKQTRTFCYASDAVAGFFKVLLLGKNGEAYNIGTPDPEVTILELAETMADAMGNGVAVKTIDYPDNYPADEPQRRCPDITKARDHLNYNPTIGFKEGLRRTTVWYRSKHNL